MLPLPLPSNTVFPHSGFASGDVAFDTLSVQWVTQASGVTTMLQLLLLFTVMTTAAGLSPPAPRTSWPLPKRLLLAFVPVVCLRAHAAIQCARNASYVPPPPSPTPPQPLRLCCYY
jgi:hypothetical protein